MGAFNTWNSDQFSSNLMMLVQRKMNALMGAVTVSYDFDNDEFAFVNQMGPIELDKVTTRLGESNWDEVDAYRRRISKEYWQKRIIFDDFEKLNTMVDPNDKTVMSLAAGANRRMEKIILESAIGTAFGGRAGATSIPFDSNQVIAVGTTGLTVEDKLIPAKTKFTNNNVDDGEQKYFIASASSMASLLKTTKATSADYNTVRALMQGEIDSFCSFKFITLPDGVFSSLGLVDGNTHSCLAWVPSGVEIKIARNPEIITYDRLPEHNDAHGIVIKLAMGGTRLEEEKVLKVNVDVTK